MASPAGMPAMTKPLLLLITAALVFTGCGRGATENAVLSSKNITVSAAVSLRDAFAEIGGLYRTRTGITVIFNYGASGALQKQIEGGAPVDVFAGAGEKQMDELASKGLIDDPTRRDLAQNSLVLIVPADSKLEIGSFADLDHPSIQKIAVGNPKTVPAGQYADTYLDRSGLKNALAGKLIHAEDVRQVLEYTARGETDAGMVYATDARIARDRVRVAAVADTTLTGPILYPIAVVKGTAHVVEARAFVDLATGGEGQAILRKYGFKEAPAK
jgi:molybdate transport system substrate-binding protein